MKFFNIFLYCFLAISSLPILAEPNSNIVIDTSDSNISLTLSQSGNSLHFSCNNSKANLQTILTTVTPYAYYADDSLLIMKINGIYCQIPGVSSASTFVSTETCDFEDRKRIQQQIQSSQQLDLELEAVSMSSGKSSKVHFSLNKTLPELQSFMKKCQVLLPENIT